MVHLSFQCSRGPENSRPSGKADLIVDDATSCLELRRTQKTVMEAVAVEIILASPLGFVNLGELLNPSGLFFLSVK